MKGLIFSLICFVLVSCGNQQPARVNHASYIDVSAFVQQQITLLDSTKPALVKYSKWNEKANTDTIIQVDWNEELALFKEIKISPASWKTDYELIDSVVIDDQTIRAFGALLDQLEIRFLEVVTNPKGDLIRFNVELRSENRFNKSNRKMSYTANKGFTVAGLREVWLMQDETYKIVCQLLKQS